MYAFATSSLTELRLRETGRERKCIHPLGDSFGSLAVIAAVLLQQPEVIQLPLPRSPCGHHWICVRRATVCRRTRTGRLAGGERDARQRDEQGQDDQGGSEEHTAGCSSFQTQRRRS